MILHTNLFEHKSVVNEEGSIVISPSSLYKFFDNPKTWYEETVLGKVLFRGNTASVIGTICHYLYDCAYKENYVDRNLIETDLRDYIIKYNLHDEINYNQVLNDYGPTADAVYSNYIAERGSYRENTETEVPLSYCLDKENKIYLAGTCDRIEKDQKLVVDFKTVGKKPNELALPFAYKVQLMAYSYLLRINGLMDPTRIRVVYGVKPQKTIGARCIVVEELITEDHWQLINSTLELVVDTLKYIKQHPESTYLIFKSMELKNG